LPLDPFEIRLNGLESDIQKLRMLYDQYFRGVSNDIPQNLHDAVAREVRAFSTGIKTLTQNTSFKFRSQQLVARYNSYLHVWQKGLRDIEEGRVQRKRIGSEKVDHVLDTNVFVFSTPASEAGELERMIKRVRLEYKRLGHAQTPEASRLRQMVEEQTRAVRERFKVHEVAYEVLHEGDKVRIRVKPVGAAARVTGA
jgi:hypothetical protein